MTYVRGTKDEFESWHTKEKARQGIPPEGKVGEVEGVLSPNTQRTYAITEPVKNPTNSEDIIWKTTIDQAPKDKSILTDSDARQLAWEAVETRSGRS